MKTTDILVLFLTRRNNSDKSITTTQSSHNDVNYNHFFPIINLARDPGAYYFYDKTAFQSNVVTRTRQTFTREERTQCFPEMTRIY